MDTAIFDADSHLMETPDGWASSPTPSVRERLAPLGLGGAGSGAAELMASLPDLWASQREADIGPEVLKGPKGWMAPGALDTDVRSRVLDALGIEAQLVFPTFATGHFAFSKDPDVLYGGADALNRAMVVVLRARRAAQGRRLPAAERARTSRRDPRGRARRRRGRPLGALGRARLLLAHPRRSRAGLGPAGRGGRALRAPRRRGQAPAQGVPQQRAAPAQGLVGRRREPALQGLPGAAPLARALPRLHGARRGVRAPPASCAAAPSSSGPAGFPACCATSITRSAPSTSSSRRCGELSLLPSDYLRRQVRFTPFPFEDTAWLVEQCGPELFMFSTDYPHPEGGKRPFEAFGEAVAGFDEATQERFFWRNGAELLGLA